jgi:lipoate-protein ligase A
MRLGVRRCRLVEYTRLDGPKNMAIDGMLLALGEQDPESAFVRFYTWAGPTLSMGHFEPPDAVDSRTAREDGVVIVRRPTGGRVVLHGDDLTYTVVLPRGDGMGPGEIYSLVSKVLVEGLAALGTRLAIRRGRAGRSRVLQKPCFASVSRFEITHRGRKVVGSAQRRGERAVLQHGSIPLGHGYLDVVKYMKVPAPDREVLLAEMRTQTACLADVLGRRIDPEEVARALGTAFRRELRCDFSDQAVDELEAVGVGSGPKPA